MELHQVKEKVILCVRQIEENEKRIIQNDVNERTIAHKFAEYLKAEFPDWDVDVEYNRNFEDGESSPKYVDRVKDFHRNLFKDAIKSERDVEDLINTVSSYPDIIIHERMTNNRNFLVIEIKKDNNRTDPSIDLEKLEAFTRSKDRRGYGYTFGLHITFHVGEWREPVMQWFQDGDSINNQETDQLGEPVEQRYPT